MQACLFIEWQLNQRSDQTDQFLLLRPRHRTAR
jgi:hypothetical protein